MLKVAEEYYALLEEVPAADPARVLELRRRLDVLEEPFAKDMAFVASLRAERRAAELGLR